MVITLHAEALIIFVITLSVITFLSVGILIFWMFRERAKTNRLTARIDDLKTRVNEQYLSQQAMLNQLATLEDQTVNLSQLENELQDNKENRSAYKQALKMIEMGADLEDIISTCELNRAEAELLMNLQTYKQVRECVA